MISIRQPRCLNLVFSNCFTINSKRFLRGPASRAQQNQDHVDETPNKFLKVAIIGPPNAGKSTLVNLLLGTYVSCVSNKVHTTRHNTHGVVTYPEHNTQIEFIDAPGMVKKENIHKHRLEDSLLYDPTRAVIKSELIAVLADANNIRDQRRLNKGVVELLKKHNDKPAILILNKVDLIKKRGDLIDFTTRLTQGCMDNKPYIRWSQIKDMTPQEIKSLNLTKIKAFDDKKRKFLYERYEEGIEGSTEPNPRDVCKDEAKKQHEFVIDLGTASKLETMQEPDMDEISYPGFTKVFYLSCLTRVGIKELTDYLVSMAKPIEELPHPPDHISHETEHRIAIEIVKGKVFDNTEGAFPYLVSYKLGRFSKDELGSLHIYIDIICTSSYYVSTLLRDSGAKLFKIIEETRPLLCSTFGCEVNLRLNVKARNN